MKWLDKLLVKIVWKVSGAEGLSGKKFDELEKWGKDDEIVSKPKVMSDDNNVYIDDKGEVWKKEKTREEK